MGNFDGLRGLTVTYNALKHPKTVASGTTSTLTYIYDAVGNKLAVSQDGTVKNYYCGDFVYTSGLAVDYILTPNGQMTRNPSTGAYTAQYNITDHLGNVRSVVNSSGVSQKNSKTILKIYISPQQYYQYNQNGLIE